MKGRAVTRSGHSPGRGEVGASWLTVRSGRKTNSDEPSGAAQAVPGTEDAVSVRALRWGQARGPQRQKHLAAASLLDRPEQGIEPPSWIPRQRPVKCFLPQKTGRKEEERNKEIGQENRQQIVEKRIRHKQAESQGIKEKKTYDMI